MQARADVASHAVNYRPELHGLRATAILMVAVYHIWVGRVSGGIDVFLLISSFLLMQTFMRRVERDSGIGLVEYWLKAFKRLLPPAVVTILGTVIAVEAFFPPERIRGALSEAVASLCYHENWYLAENSLDYYADKSSISPLQHFWSLSIQGQIFVLWPAIIALCWFVAKKTKLNVRVLLFVVFGAIFALSLVWSIYDTANNQSYAYFSTWTRLWEFALGALLALILPKIEGYFGYGPGIKAHRDMHMLLGRVVLGWVGLIAMLLCGVVIDVEGKFPGYIALWPLGAAILVLVAGNTGIPFACDRILASGPLKFLGDISYALYLVHWPVLITTLQLTKSSQVTLWQGVIVLAISISLAAVLTKSVDAPIRYSAWAAKRKLNSAAIVVLSLAVGLTPVLTYQKTLNDKADSQLEYSSANNPGALVLQEDYLPIGDPNAQTLPLRENIEREWAAISGSECMGEFAPDDPVLDEFCVHAPGDPQKVALITGNSRVEQYVPFLEPALKEQGWTIVQLLKGGCPLINNDSESLRIFDYLMQTEEGAPQDSDVHDTEQSPAGAESQVAETSVGTEPQEETECSKWSRAVDEYILRVKPGLVITGSTIVPQIQNRDEVITPGLEKLVEKYTSEGIDVLALRDEPRIQKNPFHCIDELKDTLDDLEAPMANELIGILCGVEKDKMFADPDPALQLHEHVRGDGQLFLFDPTPWICPDGFCPTIIGNVHVYLDHNHLTSTYSKTMYPLVKDQLQEILVAAAS